LIDYFKLLDGFGNTDEIV